MIFSMQYTIYVGEGRQEPVPGNKEAGSIGVEGLGVWVRGQEIATKLEGFLFPCFKRQEAYNDHAVHLSRF